MNLGEIRKALAAAVTTLAVTVTAVMADDVIDATEWGTLVSCVVVGALGVYAVWRIPNDRPKRAVTRRSRPPAAPPVAGRE